MNPQEAREILSVFRPGTEDEHDPAFAEALDLARANPELRAWLADSIAFDDVLKADLARVAAPAALRESILAERKIVRPAPWWQHRLTRPQWAAAAAVAMAGALLAVWFGTRPTPFAEFQRDIADESWGATPHVQVKVSSMTELRHSLETRNLPSRFTVPSTLAPVVRGYSLVNWHGRELPVICFASEGQHLHLVVADRADFRDAPTGVPQTDQWQSWRTASWSRDDFSYVLTGLNTQTFVKKFRKDKRWDWEG
jgi:hypothetical protein